MITGTKRQMLKKLSGNLRILAVQTNYHYQDDLGNIHAPGRMDDTLPPRISFSRLNNGKPGYAPPGWLGRAIRTYGEIRESATHVLHENFSPWEEEPKSEGMPTTKKIIQLIAVPVNTCALDSLLGDEEREVVIQSPHGPIKTTTGTAEGHRGVWYYAPEVVKKEIRVGDIVIFQNNGDAVEVGEVTELLGPQSPEMKVCSRINDRGFKWVTRADLRKHITGLETKPGNVTT
jgi:hypothetical protein